MNDTNNATLTTQGTQMTTKKLTFMQLCNAMQTGDTIQINGIKGRVVSIQPESGNSNITCWIVHVRYENNSEIECFVRTI